MLMLNVTGAALSPVYASYSSMEYGRVSMQGSIINSPCAIATADSFQTIDMKVTTVGEIIDNGQGLIRPFSVTLVNCIIDESTSYTAHFSTTFDGPSEDGVFSLSGVQGVGLQIADSAGNIASPGVALPEGQLKIGTLRLDYTLRLVRTHSPLKAGIYSAVLRFKVDYF